MWARAIIQKKSGRFFCYVDNGSDGGLADGLMMPKHYRYYGSCKKADLRCVCDGSESGWLGPESLGIDSRCKDIENGAISFGTDGKKLRETRRCG